MIAKANINAVAMAKSRSRAVSGGASANIYFVLICVSTLAVSLVSMYAVLLVLFGLLPAMIAIIIDQEGGRYISKLVGIYNAIGIFPFIQKIIKSSNPNSAALEIILDPKSWMLIFCAAAIGWGMYWLCPQIAIAINKIRISTKIMELKAELKTLTDEWGDEISTLK